MFKKRFYIISFLLILTYIIGFFIFKDNIYFVFFFSFFLITFLILLSVKANNVNFEKYKLLSFFFFIGKISYGIYIYHIFIPEILHYFGLKTLVYSKINLFNVITCVVSVFVSAVSWYTVEKYFLSFKNKFRY